MKVFWNPDCLLHNRPSAWNLLWRKSSLLREPGSLAADQEKTRRAPLFVHRRVGQLVWVVRVPGPQAGHLPLRPDGARPRLSTLLE